MKENLFEFETNFFVCALPLDKRNNVVRIAKEDQQFKCHSNFCSDSDNKTDKLIFERLKQ